MTLVARSATPERARVIRANMAALTGAPPSLGLRDASSPYRRPPQAGARYDAPRLLMLMVARQIQRDAPARAAAIRANVRACQRDRDRIDHPPRVALEFNLAAQARQLELVELVVPRQRRPRRAEVAS